MASFDLGALVSGLSRGMGDFTQIQFAEQLLRDREQRRFAQEQQLAQEQFDRRKQLEMLLMDERARREAEKIGALSRGEAMKEKGVQRGEALTQRRMRSAYEKFPEYAVNEALGLDTEEQRLDRRYKESQIGANEALAEYRRSGGGGGGGIGQDSLLSDAQRQTIYLGERTRLLREKQSKIDALERDPLLSIDRDARAREIAKIEAEYADVDARALAFVQSFGGAPAGVAASGGQPAPDGNRAESLMTEVEAGAPAETPGGVVSGQSPASVEELATAVAQQWASGPRDERGVKQMLAQAVRMGTISVEQAREVIARAKEMLSSREVVGGYPSPDAELQRDIRSRGS